MVPVFKKNKQNSATNPGLTDPRLASSSVSEDDSELLIFLLPPKCWAV